MSNNNPPCPTTGRLCKHLINGAIVLAAIWLSGCAETSPPALDEVAPATQAGSAEVSTGDLDDPDIKQQLQGVAGGGDNHPGASLYTEYCADCHQNPSVRAPARNILELLAPESVLTSLEQGTMRQQAAALSAEQKRQVVEYLVGTPDLTPPKLVHCESQPDWFDHSQRPAAEGWGIDLHNTRHMPYADAGLKADQLAGLQIKWVFDYPRATRARSHPSLAGGAVFVGSQNGTVYALDQASGCVRWTYDAGAEVRTGITIPDWSPSDGGARIGYFADVLARVHAVDLLSGEQRWQTRVEDHHNATTTAQPAYFDGMLFQPVSSLEVVPAADPNYPCCSFRGSVVTLNASDGQILRRTWTIPDAPTQVASNNVGTPVLAPSGAPVWNTPTIDTDARRMYFGTGENYSSPADGNSDAIFAVDIDSGEIQWVRQTTAGDAWNVACMSFIENKTNCPAEQGPDVDFGAPPILVIDGNRRILVAGQKSGEVYGINPSDGTILWEQKVGRGGNQGGMHFGMAAQGTTVYVPIADYTDPSLSAADAKPGMYALNAFSGAYLWSHPAPEVCGDTPDCDPGISAAVSAVDGAVIAGHMDGHLRAYAREDGRLLWDLDANTTFTSVAGNTAHGGSFGGGSAPVAYRGRLFVNSGYGLYFHMPGNVLIALGPPETP